MSGEDAMRERLAEALAPLAKWVADNAPMMQQAIDAWTDHGIAEAEMWANWGDHPYLATDPDG